MSGESRGWNGAGIGIGLETTYGTDPGSSDVWLKIVKESLKENKVPRRRRSIIPVATAAAQAAFPKSGRFHGLNIPGGDIEFEGLYQGFDRLLYNLFGDPAITDADSAYTKVFPNAVDQPTKPGLTFTADRDSTSLKVKGGVVEAAQFTIVPEEAMQIVLSIIGQTSAFSGSGVTPSWLSEEHFIEDHHALLEVSVDGGAYAELEFDGFNVKYEKNLRKVPVHDGSVNGIRQPIRIGYPKIAGQVARLYQNATYYDEYAALDELGLKLTCESSAIAGTGSAPYKLIIELKNCMITDTGPVTEDEGPRAEVIDFEVDTDASTAAMIVTTVNEDDGTWAT